MVNLNFTLCHSPADPFYDKLGYYYYAVAVIHLNMASYALRWFTYFQLQLIDYFGFGFVRINDKEEETNNKILAS